MNPDGILAFAGLTGSQLIYCLVAVFVAGLVRGFTGFGLPALVMASMVVLWPPIEVLPIIFLLELVAGLAMLRNGVRDADMRIVKLLVVGSALGLPFGLWWLQMLPQETTKLVALSVILLLSIALLVNVKPRGLDHRVSVFGAGAFSGIITGISGVGGLVIVIFNLAVGLPAQVVRGTVVLYLFGSLIVSMVFYFLFGIFTLQALVRFGLLVVPTAAGVYLGTRLFSPASMKYYRAFCLVLLILLSLFGIATTMV